MSATPNPCIFFGDDELRYEQCAGADLRGHAFNNAILTFGDFRRANLTGVHFVVRAYRADFTHANFTGAAARNASFFGCDFHAADFTSADFSGVRFGNSDLTGVCFANADLLDADLQSTVGLNPKALIQARNWRHATLPSHVRREAEILALLQLRRGASFDVHRHAGIDEPEIEIEIDLTGDEPRVELHDSANAAWSEFTVETNLPKPVQPPRPTIAARAVRLYAAALPAPLAMPTADSATPGVLDRDLAL